MPSASAALTRVEAATPGTVDRGPSQSATTGWLDGQGFGTVAVLRGVGVAAGREVGGVVVGVGAAGGAALHRGRVAGGGSGPAAFEEVGGGAVADQVHDLRQRGRGAGGRAAVAAERGGGVHQGDLAGGRGQGDRGGVGDVRGGEGCADRGVGGLLDQQVLAGSERDVGKLGDLAAVLAEVARAAGAGVLDRPAAHRRGGRAPVEQLDEVVGVGRAAVAAAAVHLADDDAGRDRVGGSGQAGDGEGEHHPDQQHPPELATDGWDEHGGFSPRVASRHVIPAGIIRNQGHFVHRQSARTAVGRRGHRPGCRKLDSGHQIIADLFDAALAGAEAQGA